MASELTVQTIKGPTSGGNANKILVPSGQTIDASAGTLVPSAGQVVQCVSRVDTRSHIATSSTSYVASGVSHSITPKFSDSIILIHYHIPMSHTPNDTLIPRIYRNGTDLSGATFAQGYHTNSNQYITMTLEGRDDGHNSTSSLTYEIYFKSNGGNQIFMVHNSSDTNLKLWEIKA